MKNVIKTIKKSILLVTVFTTMLSNATEISSLIKEELKRTSLIINNAKEGDLLSIKDYNGIILYKEQINISGIYKKGFDLTALPNGKYFFEIEKDLEVKTIPFTVNSNTVVFSKNKEVTVFKPLVRQKNGLVLISKLALNSKPIQISVFSDVDGGYKLIHKENVEAGSDLTIKRVYKLEKGNRYKLIIYSDNKEFTKFINN